MKWGDRHQNGCSDANCLKVHPTVCSNSLDLICLDRKCASKLHTFKCKRSNPSSPKRAPLRNRQVVGPSGGPNGPVHGRGGAHPNPWMVNPRQSAPQHDSVPPQSFQNVTVQPQLEAYMTRMRHEMWEEMRVMRTLLSRELQLAQQGGPRPSY